MQAVLDSTVKLRSRYWNDLSIELNAAVNMSAPSLRRRVAPLRLLIPARREIDVCEKFEIDADEAEALLRGSPQVRKWMSRGFLSIARIDPPADVVEPVPEPVVVAPTPAALPEPVEVFGLSEPIQPELTRKELVVLCEEHDIVVSKRWTKAKIREKLAAVGADS